MNKIITIQADPIEKINPKTDTTLLLALEAQRRNCKIYWYETKDVSFINSKLIANIKEVKLFNNKKKYFKIMKRKKFDLSNSKFILILHLIWIILILLYCLIQLRLKLKF